MQHNSYDTEILTEVHKVLEIQNAIIRIYLHITHDKYGILKKKNVNIFYTFVNN